MKTLFRMCFVIVALFACGCASVRTEKVDAIASQRPVVARAFVIVPADPKLSPGDLRFQEAANITALALEAHGYTHVEDAARADVIVALDATMGPAETVYDTRSGEEFPDVGGFYCIARVPVRGHGGNVFFVRSAIWNPPLFPHAYGYETHTFSKTIFEKRLTLTACANGSSNAQELSQLWSVVVVERDESGDLRSCLPSMAVVAARYAEHDTKGQVTVRLRGDDAELVRIAPAKADGK
jgi:hypothetical protein